MFKHFPINSLLAHRHTLATTRRSFGNATNPLSNQQHLIKHSHLQILASESNHPNIAAIVRCGSLLHSNCRLPSPSVLFDNNVDAVEVVLQWQQHTEVWERVHRSFGTGKDKIEWTQDVKHRGQQVEEPCMVNVWTYDASMDVDDTTDINAHVKLDIPLGLGPSFRSSKSNLTQNFTATEMEQLIASVNNPAGHSKHFLKMRAVLAPIEMNKFQSFIRFHWSYVFLGKGSVPVFPAEKITIDQQPLLLLPSLTKRSSLLLKSQSSLIEGTKTFFSFGAMMEQATNVLGSLGSLFGFGNAADEKNTDSSGSSTCAAEFVLDKDVLVGNETFSGNIHFNNHAIERHPISTIGIQVKRDTTYSASGSTAEKTKVLYKEQIFEQEKQTEQEKNVTFELTLPPLSPSFETELMQVRYCIEAHIEFLGGTVKNPYPQVLTCPVVVVSPLQAGEEHLEGGKGVEGVEGMEGVEGGKGEEGMEGMEGMEEVEGVEGGKGVVEVIEVVGMEKLERTKDAAKTETVDLAQVLEQETILAETTVAAEFIEAVSLVEHRLAKLDNDDLRFRLRALRLQSNIGGWMRYERKKASARRSKRRKGRKKGSSHRTRGTGGNGNDTCSASVEEMEQIVNSVDTGVIDEWKKLGDMSVNTAKEVYVNTARKEL